ncbi:hypothetical protein NKJ90_08060, partial [Mesorhizobium sp. M0051]|uniref:hypothetical protein n=1 Tax=Mesorhizobium sp. M0051 TaxID=2956862 RepID=UPI0033368310
VQKFLLNSHAMILLSIIMASCTKFLTVPGIYGFHQFFAAFNTFFEERTRTKFGAQPKALFNLEWRTSLPLLKPWGRLMDEAYDNNTALPGTIYNAPHQTVRIEPSNSLFPGANDPFRAAIANAALSVVCYRAEVFEQLLQTPTEELPQADLDLRLPLGTFANTANDDGLSLSYRWQGPASDAVVLFSNTPLIYRPGIGRYHRHPAIEFIEDLYGGACRVKLEATDPAQESGVAQLDRALRFNGACLHLFLTADTHTPVSFTAYLPLGRDLSAGELWGILPDLEPGGTVDDLACQ